MEAMALSAKNHKEDAEEQREKCPDKANITRDQSGKHYINIITQHSCDNPKQPPAMLWDSSQEYLNPKP